MVGERGPGPETINCGLGTGVSDWRTVGLGGSAGTKWRDAENGKAGRRLSNFNFMILGITLLSSLTASLYIEPAPLEE
jgi:hypothetical protein